jgi:hypothetical protein
VDFARNFYDVSFGIACDVKPAGNKEFQIEPEGYDVRGERGRTLSCRA